MSKKKMKQKQEGFTLIELLVVLAILGVLAALLVPKIMGNVDSARARVEVSNARTVANEITAYNAELPKEERIKNDSDGYVSEDSIKKVHTLEEGKYTEMYKYAKIKIDDKGNATVEQTDTAKGLLTKSTGNNQPANNAQPGGNAQPGNNGQPGTTH